MAKFEIENEEIISKKECLRNAEILLKKEFIGIDKIIENTIMNIRPWYLYPELQEKPLVITLVGLTGTGKTSFVKRLVQLLDIEKYMSYFNFAEIGELSSQDIQYSLDHELTKCGSNRIFVYDEFQYAATLDNSGAEKDNVTGLKPFWELMDSGKIHMKTDFGDIFVVRGIIDCINKISTHKKIIIKNNEWINMNECLVGFDNYQLDYFNSFFSIDEYISNNRSYKNIESSEDDIDNLRYDSEFDEFIKSSNKNFLNDWCMGRLYDVYKKYVSHSLSKLDFYNKIIKMNLDEFTSLLDELNKKLLKGYDVDFEKSIIFVLMNLDEAYTMSFDMDPDMLPDQFNKITEKITIVDIKEALKERFRNEQIARLGNIFMIYPSFTSESYKKIIELYLNKYADKVKSKWGIEIKYDDSIKDILYKDTVFPTQGTRPIFSGIHEIVKTKLPLIIDMLSNDNIKEIDSIDLKYADNNVIAEVESKGDVVAHYNIPQELRIENKRDVDDSEQQVRVAVHESGHFAIYAALMGKVPEKLCSKALSQTSNGFLLFDMDDNRMWTKDEIMTSIKIALGGYVAEGIVFGNNKRGSGAANDLLKATVYASRMIRDYGMGANPYVTTYLINDMSTQGGSIINFDDQDKINQEITFIIDKCLKDVYDILSKKCWRTLMKTSAIYLSQHPSMTKETMSEIYENNIPVSERYSVDKEYYIRSLENFNE